jgi:hypothetical protein
MAGALEARGKTQREHELNVKQNLADLKQKVDILEDIVLTGDHSFYPEWQRPMRADFQRKAPSGRFEMIGRNLGSSRETASLTGPAAFASVIQQTIGVNPGMDGQRFTLSVGGKGAFAAIQNAAANALQAIRPSLAEFSAAEAELPKLFKRRQPFILGNGSITDSDLLGRAFLLGQ